MKANLQAYLKVGDSRALPLAESAHRLRPGAPAIADDERFATNQLRTSNRDALKSALEDLLASHDGVSLAIRLSAAGVPAGPVLTLAEVVKHPHTHHRGMIVDIANYRGTGSPIKMSRTPATYRLPPPTFGEHNAEILKNADEPPRGPVAD